MQIFADLCGICKDQQWSLRPNKKIMSFPVTRPTHVQNPRPKIFYETFWPKTYFRPIILVVFLFYLSLLLLLSSWNLPGNPLSFYCLCFGKKKCLRYRKRLLFQWVLDTFTPNVRRWWLNFFYVKKIIFPTDRPTKSS